MHSFCLPCLRLVMMCRWHIAPHGLPQILSQDPVNLVVSIVVLDTVITVRKEVGLVSMIACER